MDRQFVSIGHSGEVLLRINRKDRTLSALEKREIADAGFWERRDIQQMMRQSADAFFSEMGEELKLIGEEIRPADFVEDRIDLLAIDPEGSLVVVELKRDSHKLQLLQAIAYAGMISKWDSERIYGAAADFMQATRQEALEVIEDFLGDSAETLNSRQRIILLAQDYSFEVLIGAEWLSEKYGVDVRCYRIELSVDGQAEYLACTRIYPPTEITQHAIAGRPSRIRPLRWADWDVALASIENTSVVDFFRAELSAGRSNYLRRRSLRYAINGKRRIWMSARRQHSYVWQVGRFGDDVAFWTRLLGTDARVQPVKDGQALRFFLGTKAQFDAFSHAVRNELTNVDFAEPREQIEESIEEAE